MYIILHRSDPKKVHKRIRKLKTREYSLVYKHSYVANHKFDLQNPNILESDKVETRLKIKEILLNKEYSAHELILT